MKDIKHSLKERWLQLFWPEDGRWWPGQVTEVHAKERKISLLYKTGAHLAALQDSMPQESNSSCACMVYGLMG